MEMVTKLHIVLNQSSRWEAGGIPSDRVSNDHTGHIPSVYLRAGPCPGPRHAMAHDPHLPPGEAGSPPPHQGGEAVASQGCTADEKLALTPACFLGPRSWSSSRRVSRQQPRASTEAAGARTGDGDPEM